MMDFIRIVAVLFEAFFFSRLRLVAENLALRQQLVVLQRTGKRPRLRKRDRIFWVWLPRTKGSTSGPSSTTTTRSSPRRTTSISAEPTAEPC